MLFLINLTQRNDYNIQKNYLKFAYTSSRLVF